MVLEPSAADKNAAADSDQGDADLNGLTHRDYAEHLQDVVELGQTPWHLYGRILRPVSMPHVAIEVDPKAVRRAIDEVGALLAYWTTDWDRAEPSEWWWTVCDQTDYEVENVVSSRGRRAIRRGLRDCTVRLIESGDFSELAYPIYRQAVLDYGSQPPSHDAYAKQVDSLAGYAGTQFWGAFVDEQLAAFAACELVDGAVVLGSTKSDPEMDSHNANAALFYELTRFNLERGAQYVTNGSRTVLHPTTINEYLERLGYRKAYCRLNVILSRTASIADRTRIAEWGARVGLARLLGTRWPELEGFDRLVRIAGTFE